MSGHYGSIPSNLECAPGESIRRKADGSGWEAHTAGGGPASPFVLEAFLALDVSTGANTTPVNLTGFSFNFEAASRYVLELFAVMQSPAATTGYGIQGDVSTAVTLQSFQFFHQLANTGMLSGGSSIADDASVGVSSGVPSNAVNVPLYGCGVLATILAGTYQLRLRSEVSAVATMKAGSILRVRKL